MISTKSVPMNAEAIVAFAQKVNEESSADAQRGAAQKVQDLRDAKANAKKELDALKARNERLTEEAKEEAEGGPLGLNLDETPIIGGLFGRNERDVAVDIQKNAIQQEHAAVGVSQAQKEISDVRSELKDFQEQSGAQQQAVQQMLALVRDLNAASTKIG